MGNNKVNPADVDFWHYTTGQGLNGILANQFIWASDFRCLNDRQEGLFWQTLIRELTLPRIINDLKNGFSTPKAEAVIASHGGIESISKKEFEMILDNMLKALLKFPAIPCVLSFCKTSGVTKKSGLLSQWRGYGKDGGYALVFDGAKLANLLEQEDDAFHYGISGWGHVIYGLDPAQMSQTFKSNLNSVCEHAYKVFRLSAFKEHPGDTTPEQLTAFVQCMMLSKHPGFQEEREYRHYAFPIIEKTAKKEGAPLSAGKAFKQVYFRECRGLVVPYIRLFENMKFADAIKAICIGPHPDQQLRLQSISTLLKSMGLDSIEVFMSEIPYAGPN